MLKLAYMGSPAFAVPSLDSLLRAGHDVRAVFCQPDRPSGRKRRIRPGPVKTLALDRGIPVHQPERLRGNREIRELMAGLELDAVVVAAYGLILPQKLLDIPRIGCINLHASLLPRYRGAAPIQHVLIGGDPVTGVSTMLMDRGMDTGPVLLQEELEVNPRDTAPELSERLSHAGAPLILQTLELMDQGSLEPVPQNSDEATYAPMLKKDDGWIDWEQTAVEIDRRIRALTPWPGTFSRCGSCRLSILEAKPLPPGEYTMAARLEPAPGEILGRHESGFIVNCGGGSLLHVLTAQPANRGAMDGTACLNGRYVCPGGRFEAPPPKVKP